MSLPLRVPYHHSPDFVLTAVLWMLTVIRVMIWRHSETFSLTVSSRFHSEVDDTTLKASH